MKKYEELVKYSKIEFNSFSSLQDIDQENLIHPKSQKLQAKYLYLINFWKHLLTGYDFYDQ